jgi:hypothetical protein
MTFKDFVTNFDTIYSLPQALQNLINPLSIHQHTIHDKWTGLPNSLQYHIQPVTSLSKSQESANQFENVVHVHLSQGIYLVNSGSFFAHFLFLCRSNL